ncbi:hypothetical protein ACFLT5_04280 [Chloroflexota bacterium]
MSIALSEVILTFPFAFLGEKLNDPQRWIEIQESFGEVFGIDCRVTLVAASDYASGQTAEPGAQEPATNPAEAKAFDQISRWAKRRGGKTSIVQT